MDRELINYLPEFLREIQEFKAIAKAEQPEFEKAWAEKDQIIENAFILTQDEASAKRWESKLGITPGANETLSDRNFRILARAQESLPFTERTFRKMLLALVNSENEFDLTIDSDNYSVEIIIALTSSEKLAEVKALAERIVPANMLLTVDLMYATHGMLSRMTHGEMHGYTHEQLKLLDFRQEREST